MEEYNTETIWLEKIRNYVEEHAPQAQRLLKELAVIPAPSGKEERRAQYCRKWLEKQGAQDVYIDEAGNVIYPYQVRHRSNLEVYMAHLDVVFPDEDRLLVRQKDHLLIGPGVGDDTANLVNLLMAAAFFAQEKPALDTGILFVADVGEEGLGNLKGCRQLIQDYGSRIARVVSFDLYLGQCFYQCVGSLRYEVSVHTEGGHSFSAFGNASAIHQISRFVCALYEQEVPRRAQTTYNVGTITGGTSVNTIAEEASILYEIRSVDAGCMEEMRQFFEKTVRRFQAEGMRLEVKQVGERPCAGRMEAAAQQQMAQLLQKACDVILEVTGEESMLEAASTDANIPLSLGIPALTLGSIVGGKAHTREEWIDLDSQRQGMRLILQLILTLKRDSGGNPGVKNVGRNFGEASNLSVSYQREMILQGDTLLEILPSDDGEGEKTSCKVLQLPVYIRELAPMAFDGWKQIFLKSWSIRQVRSWRPILKAKRAFLLIHALEQQEIIWLPLSYTGGFEAVFPEETAGIDFAAYDARFTKIQDRDLKLDMALSRLLYPVELGEEARVRYETLVKNRFRPAMLQLFSGRWNLYGMIPTRAKELFQLKTADSFLRKELLQKAVTCNQPEFAALCIEKKTMDGESDQSSELREGIAWEMEQWDKAAAFFYRRKPELEPYCGLLHPKRASEWRGIGVLEDSSKTSRLLENGNTGSEQVSRIALPAVDGRWMYYVETWLEQRVQSGSIWELARYYAHMLLHCLYLHPFQRNSNPSRLYFLACDIAVEYLVDQIFGPAKQYAWERQSVYDALRKNESILVVAYIENWLWAQLHVRSQFECRSGSQKESLLSSWEMWFMRDSHVFWEANRAPKSGEYAQFFSKEADLESFAEKEDAFWQKTKEMWSQAGNGLRQAGSKMAGKRSDAAGNDQEEACLTKREGYDYHIFLRQFMVQKEDRILDLDSYDPIYYTYGLNAYGNIPFIEALETKEVMRLEELVIVIDTSGSCSGKLVRFFLEETWSVFGQEENFFDRFEVRILQCDAVVQEDVKLTNLQEAEEYMKHLMIKGGGGTDFGAAFSYIKDLQKQGQLKHLKGILYFTDGFGTFPARAPGGRCAFIFLKSRFGQVEVPYWAEKLLLELPEGADWEPEYTGGFQVTV